MEEAAEGGDGLRVAGVFAVVFAELAGGAVEWPRFGDFDVGELDDDVERTHAGEVVGEVSAYAERGLAFALGVFVDADGAVGVERVAEYDLLGRRVDSQLTVFVDDEVELLEVVAAVDAQPLEHIGEIFREVEAEYAPAVCVIEICAESSAVGVRPLAHGDIVCHLRTIHAGNGADEFVGHCAHRRQVVEHGEVDVARAAERAGTVALAAHLRHGFDSRRLSLERGAPACAEIAERASGVEQARRLVARAAAEVAVIEPAVEPRHHVVEFGNDCKHLDFKEDGAAPRSFELD